MPENDWLLFFDRAKLFGEKPAIDRLLEKYHEPPHSGEILFTESRSENKRNRGMHVEEPEATIYLASGFARPPRMIVGRMELPRPHHFFRACRAVGIGSEYPKLTTCRLSGNGVGP